MSFFKSRVDVHHRVSKEEAVRRLENILAMHVRMSENIANPLMREDAEVGAEVLRMAIESVRGPQWRADLQRRWEASRKLRNLALRREDPPFTADERRSLAMVAEEKRRQKRASIWNKLAAN